MKIWSELDFRMSFIQRYNMYPVLHRQSVAEHVFNVTRIARRIAVSWFDVAGDDLQTLTVWALHHDDTEALSGDLMSMAKPYFDEASFERDYAKTLPGVVVPPYPLKEIVKLADIMDVYTFFLLESSLGSTAINGPLRDTLDRVYEYARTVLMKDYPNIMENLDQFRREAELSASTRTRLSRRGWPEQNLHNDWSA